MKIIQCKQGTDEWRDVKRSKFSASNFHYLFNDTKTCQVMLTKKAFEKVFNREGAEGFCSEAMERGTLLEPDARFFYEIATGNKVTEVGFVEYNEFAGCSPDGLVGDDGGIEIKCLNLKNHLKAIEKLKAGNLTGISPQYKTQIQYCMFCTDRKWWDFVLHNPDAGEDMLYIHRVYRDEEYIKKIDNTLQKRIIDLKYLINSI